MIKIINGNILQTKEDIIVHQVNCMGVMGAGLAKQIKEKYPQVYSKYKRICYIYEPQDLLGKVLIVETHDNKKVVNLFGQLHYGRNKQYTDYDAIKNGLLKLNKLVTTEGRYFNKTIAIPYGMGAGLGGGDWSVIYEIINEVFNNYKHNVFIYKLIKEG